MQEQFELPFSANTNSAAYPWSGDRGVPAVVDTSRYEECFITLAKKCAEHSNAQRQYGADKVVEMKL